MSRAFCEHCGRNLDSLPSMGYGQPELACFNLDCVGVHPYIVAQAAKSVKFELDEFKKKCDSLLNIDDIGKTGPQG